MKKLLVMVAFAVSCLGARAQLFTADSFTGALLGAGLGAAIGHGAGDAGKGAAIGAASGWFLGTVANDYRRSRYEDHYGYGYSPYRQHSHYAPGYGHAPYRVEYANNPVVVYQRPAASESQTAATLPPAAEPAPAYTPRPARPMDGANSLFGR